MYHEVLDDPKVQQLPAIVFKGWINLLCLAARNDGKIPEVKKVAFALRLTEQKAEALLGELCEANLLEHIPLNGYVPHNWNVRQFKSDYSYERVKRFRNGKRNDDETVDETPPETDTETEQKQTQREEAFTPTEELFQLIWKEYPQPKGRKAALRHFKASVKTETDLENIKTALNAYKTQRLTENARWRDRGKDPIPWQHGSTWFNNWKDWIPEDFEKPDEKHTQHICMFCDLDPHVWQCDDPDCTLSESAACKEFREKHKSRMAVKV